MFCRHVMHIINIFILKFGIDVIILFTYTYKIAFMVKFIFYKFVKFLKNIIVLRLFDLGPSPVNGNFFITIRKKFSGRSYMYNMIQIIYKLQSVHFKSRRIWSQSHNYIYNY